MASSEHEIFCRRVCPNQGVGVLTLSSGGGGGGGSPPFTLRALSSSSSQAPSSLGLSLPWTLLLLIPEASSWAYDSEETSLPALAISQASKVQPGVCVGGTFGYISQWAE